MQIHKYKYTNTASVKVADRHEICYIFTWIFTGQHHTLKALGTDT